MKNPINKVQSVAKNLFLSALFLAMASTAGAQNKLDLGIIEETVKNEQNYFKQIVEVFQTDDPYIRMDDIALVYYGQAYLPTYNTGKDENVVAMNKYYQEDNYPKMYETANKILKYNPTNLDALFFAYLSAKTIGKEQEEYLSYINKYQNVVRMITEYGDGKSAETAFHIIHPSDQRHVLFALNIENEVSHELDPETLCNIVVVEPTKEFQARRVYFNLSIFLNHAAKK